MTSACRPGPDSPAGLRSLFEDAAAGLSPGEAEVTELLLRQGLEPGELATVLGVSRAHAHQLLSRARQQLESCLGVLLVGRSGRGECGELGSLLAGWDGRLTATLRTRVHRHIEQCGTCTARRAQELRPARLLNLSPGAALAAGAAESFQRTRGAPATLRAPTIALAAGHGAGAAARRSAVLARAGAFGRRGFPRPARAGWAGLAGPRGLAAARAGLRSWLWPCRPDPAAVSPGPRPVLPGPWPASVTTDRNAVHVPHNYPFTKNSRQLRSWIESDRLR